MENNPNFLVRSQAWATASWINFALVWVVMGAIALSIGAMIDKTPKPLFGLGLFSMMAAIQAGGFARKQNAEPAWKWFCVVASLMAFTFYLLHFSDLLEP